MAAESEAYVMAVHWLSITPRMPLSGRKRKNPSMTASTESAAPRAFTTSTTGVFVTRASSYALVFHVVSPAPS